MSAVLDTLADPTRRRVVESLRQGELAVNEIVARVGIDQSGVSRHLRILGEAGIVHVRPSGRQRFYSLQPRPFLELEEWVTRYRALWEKRVDRLEEALATRRGRRVQ